MSDSLREYEENRLLAVEVVKEIRSVTLRKTFGDGRKDEREFWLYGTSVVEGPAKRFHQVCAGLKRMGAPLQADGIDELYALICKISGVKAEK